jgi:hypothetical protein
MTCPSYHDLRILYLAEHITDANSYENFLYLMSETNPDTVISLASYTFQANKLRVTLLEA